MEISVRKRNKKSDRYDIEYLSIEKYNVLTESTNLIFVREEESHIEFFKVAFIASCTTILKNDLLVAFFLDKETGTGGVLNGYIISNNLPEEYDNLFGCSILDYEGYQEICNLTGEEIMSFSDYYKEMKDGNYLINSIEL